MSNQTYQQATVLYCPEELEIQAAAVLAAYGNSDIDASAELDIDTTYYIEEGPIGTAEETAAALAALSREIIADTWESSGDGSGSRQFVLGGKVLNALGPRYDLFGMRVELEDILDRGKKDAHTRAVRLLELARRAGQCGEDPVFSPLYSPDWAR